MVQRLENTPGLLRLYLRMVGMRAFEEACLSGFAAREIHGELHLGTGQEGIAAAMAEVLRVEDALVSTHRNHLHALAKGVAPYSLMAEIFERATGLCRGRGGHMHPFDLARNFSATGIVGSSIPVAAGYAYAYAMEQEPRVAVAVTGEGGTNQGAFHEVLNMAAAWTLPLVIIVENNGWAISVPHDAVTAPPGIAERATAYGIVGMKVDGRDVEATTEALSEAVSHARSGKGPVLFEATCSRFRGHYEGDADSYRSREERQRMKRQDDPIIIARERLLQMGHEQDVLESAEAATRAEIDDILARVRADPFPEPADAGAYVFAAGAP